ncbi:hypothetical protein DQ04_00101080 [Trypanosoma grayi]|uniref:hypothetical protein n=1 Tax=Trypanosoma grayi TaxID=71804 RepID=UPI0004F4B172|nr:hypothetical protein DQ04_00101080 [Trypanosoma grayi]KEG15341.1 hypothetical protein DQ04_00101080 [Trypanosoma grayi]
MSRYMEETTERPPRHDAPPYDPSLWEGKDCAFITTLRDVYHEQQRTERQLRSTAPAEGEVTAGWPLPTTSHTQLPSRPSTWWRNLLVKFFPRYSARQRLSSLGFEHMKNDELVNRMHFALQAGDMELSALIAQELARRRVRLYEAEEYASNRGGRSAPVAGGWFSAAPNQQAGFTSGGVESGSGGHLSRGAPTRSSMHLSADSSFMVPEVLLQKRFGGSGGGGGGLRF